MKQSPVVAYLGGLHPDGHLRQAKVNALRERWLSNIETTIREWGA